MIFRRKRKDALTAVARTVGDVDVVVDPHHEDDDEHRTMRSSLRKLLCRPISRQRIVIGWFVLSCVVLLLLVRRQWRRQSEDELELLKDPGPALPPLQNVISDAAWQQLLERFQDVFHRPDSVVSANDIWLPVVIQNRQLWFRKEHVEKLKGMERFDFFYPMMQHALSETVERKALGHPPRQHKIPLHLPLASHQSIPLILGFGDFKQCYGRIFPRFSWCTYVQGETACPNFAIPSYNVYRIRKPKAETKKNFHGHREHHWPWASKKRQAVWRGAATGFLPTNNGTWASLHRAQLVNYSIHHPELFDGGFMHSGQFSVWFPEEEPNLRKFSRFVNYTPIEQYQTYRAVVDIDGNSWSSRFGELLCMNSVIIKVQPGNKNYFDDELVPWRHYIPVKHDLSDFLDALRFAVSDDNADKVKAIIYQANEFCRLRLARDHLAKDLFWIINGYLEMLGKNATRWRQWNELYQANQQNSTFVALK